MEVATPRKTARPARPTVAHVRARSAATTSVTLRSLAPHARPIAAPAPRPAAMVSARRPRPVAAARPIAALAPRRAGMAFARRQRPAATARPTAASAVTPGSGRGGRTPDDGAVWAIG